MFSWTSQMYLFFCCQFCSNILSFSTKIKKETIEKKEETKMKKFRNNDVDKKVNKQNREKNQEVKQKMSLKKLRKKKKQEKSPSTKKKTRECEIRRVFCFLKKVFFFLNISEISFFTVVSFAQTSFLFPEKQVVSRSLFGHFLNIYFLLFFPKQPFYKSSSFRCFSKILFLLFFFF